MKKYSDDRNGKNRILKIMLTAILCLILLFNCLTALLSALGMRQILNWLPGAFMTVDSASMQPELNIGDLIFVWRVPYEKLSVGDTVTTYTNGTYTTHKLIRLQDEKIVTKGLVNELEDRPAQKDEYFAKLVFVIPGAGAVYSIISSGWLAWISFVIILAIFSVKPIYLYYAKHKKKLHISMQRLSCALCAASFMLIPNTMTLAKFTGNVAAGKTAIAAEINFSSNYLTENGNSYDIVGWDGSDYQILIKVNNYANTLKYNETGVDLNYTLEHIKILQAGTETYATDYTVTVEEINGTSINSSGNQYSTEPSYPSGDPVAIYDDDNVLIGTRKGDYTISGGEKTSDYFRITVCAKNGNSTSLGEGDKVRFKITASSIPGNGYVSEIFAEFTMTVTTANEFVKSRSIKQSNGVALVEFNIKSATLLGLASQELVLKWQTDLVYPNLYETNLWNLRANNLCTVDEENGEMRFTMSATASMTFEFNKYTDRLSDTVHQRMRTVTVRDENGDITSEYIEIELNDTYDSYSE